MKTDMAKRAERAKIQESKYREMPDIVVRVVCKYRAELYFKISRKTKLTRLFNAWTERMETNVASTVTGKKGASPLVNGTIVGSTSGPMSSTAGGAGAMQFIFSHSGRTLEPDQTPEEAGIEDGDVILAVEMMDLTDGPGTEELDDGPLPVRQKLRKEWAEDPSEWVTPRHLACLVTGEIHPSFAEHGRLFRISLMECTCVTPFLTTPASSA